MNPNVSILVPIYGVEQFIERCAESLFVQTFQNIEYIFINDCTPDKSIVLLRKVLERFPDRKSQVRIIDHAINRGLAAARNTGVESATGEYIVHVDSDDYIDPSMVAQMYQMASSQQADIVVCDYYMEFPKSVLLLEENLRDSKQLFLTYMLSGQAMAPIWNKMIKRDLYVNHGIKALEGVNLGEDYMTVPKLTYYANKVCRVASPLYYYSQVNPAAYTVQKLSRKNIDSLVFAIDNLTDFFSKLPDAHLYDESLLQGKLRKKMDILFSAEKKYVPELANLFPETGLLTNTLFLLTRDKISYPILEHRRIALFLIYRSLYKVLFDVKKVLRGNK